LGREEPALRAPRPRSLKSWMALRTVCWPHPRFLAMRGECSPRELARRIWQSGEGRRHRRNATRPQALGAPPSKAYVRR
jgi:hypothetical protein